MSPRENFHRLMAGQGGWPTLDLPMTEPVFLEAKARLGVEDVALALGQDYRYIGYAAPEHRFEWAQAYASLGVRLPEDARIHGDGHVDRMPPLGSTGKAWHLTEMLHPLAQVDDLDKVCALPWQVSEVEEMRQSFESQVARIQGQGFVSVLPLECTVFENAWYLRGMDSLFMDLAEGNPVSEWLLDHFMERSIRTGTAAAQAGVDLVRLGDDVGTQRGMLMSVSQWRDLLKPRLGKVVEAIREAAGSRGIYLQYHSDGDIREILGDLADLGIDILNPVQPECMPLEEVVPRWQDRLAFSGMIGTQTTMPFGTPEDVRDAVRKCLDLASKGARMLIAPTHVLEPDVPWENVIALSEAVLRERQGFESANSPC